MRLFIGTAIAVASLATSTGASAAGERYSFNFETDVPSIVTPLSPDFSNVFQVYTSGPLRLDVFQSIYTSAYVQAGQLEVQSEGYGVVLSRIDGGAIDLIDFTLGSGIFSGPNATLRFFDFGNRSFATGAYDAPYDGEMALPNLDLGTSQTISVNRGNLSAVYFQGGIFSLDNIVVAIPEAPTWAMMLLGFGMMGAAMRYRRRGTTSVYA